MQEKKIRGFPEYIIGNWGEVYSTKSKKVLKKDIEKNGVCRVVLYKSGVRFRRKVHRLVALAFIPNPLKKKTVNHKDGNRLNNNVENLEWATHSEQESHRYHVLGKKNGLKTQFKSGEENINRIKAKLRRKNV